MDKHEEEELVLKCADAIKEVLKAKVAVTTAKDEESNATRALVEAKTVHDNAELALTTARAKRDMAMTALKDKFADPADG